jgi:hypothetical protein
MRRKADMQAGKKANRLVSRKGDRKECRQASK